MTIAVTNIVPGQSRPLPHLPWAARARPRTRLHDADAGHDHLPVPRTRVREGHGHPDQSHALTPCMASRRWAPTLRTGSSKIRKHVSASRRPGRDSSSPTNGRSASPRCRRGETAASLRALARVEFSPRPLRKSTSSACSSTRSSSGTPHGSSRTTAPTLSSSSATRSSAPGCSTWRTRQGR